jgi:hypothetical protein
MAIPELTTYGLLPSGVHRCSMDEVRQRFCFNPHRSILFEAFEKFINNEIAGKFNFPILADGSYVTDKEKPSDIDVVMDCRRASAEEQALALRFMLDRQRQFKQRYFVDFWVSFPGKNDFSQFFQYVRIDVAKTKGLSTDARKGLLRIKL